ncbi:MAG: small multi-drug export protein [Clostridia bacterium]|nr:small multi-drug export protein [Clostridia bacterium]
MEALVGGLTEFFKGWLSPEIIIFIVSLLPILELRGGLIAAALLGVDWAIAFPICVIGNVLPIPIILLFIRKIFDFIKKTNFLWLRKLVIKIDEKAQKKTKNMNTASLWGLFLFVGIPLPGTGAWTGSLVANILNIKPLKAFIIIILGVITAGIIMSTLTYLIPSFFF